MFWLSTSYLNLPAYVPRVFVHPYRNMANLLSSVSEVDQIEIDKLEPRLFGLLTSVDASVSTMVNLAKAGCVKAGLLRWVGDDPKELRQYLRDQGITDLLEHAKILTVHENLKIYKEVETKDAAARAIAQLPPQLALGELQQAKKAFERTEHALEREECPSQGYLERKLGEVTTIFQAEPLSTVTSQAQQDDNLTQVPHVDPLTGTFKLQTKAFGVALPRNSEELRGRLNLLGVTTRMVAMRHPEKGVLKTSSVALFDGYVRFLFGKRVWGLVSKKNGTPFSCPSLQHVLDYDLALREKIADLMNAGLDIAQAYDFAMNPDKRTTPQGMIFDELRQTAFLAQVAADSGSAECRALSAPGLRGSSSSNVTDSTKRPPPTPNAEDPQRRQKKSRHERQQAAVQRAVEKALAEAKASSSRTDADVANWPRLQGKGEGKGKGKGGGKGVKGKPSNAKARTENGEPICYGYNTQGCQKGENCPFKHVCWICEGNHHPRVHDRRA